MDDFIVKDLNGFGGRLSKVENRQENHEARISHSEKNADDVWNAIDKMREISTNMLSKLYIIIGVGVSINFVLMALSIVLSFYKAGNT